ncbi:MAG TPA: hypothetical protein VNI78_13075 [Vicinamibacterales bacterium]|nr:hypothetical protein [Vicinamibacterales bacterium]
MRRPALALALLFLPAAPAAAQTRITFIPSVSVAGVYDDNVFARVEGSVGQMLQVRPSLETNWESPRVTWLGLYSFDAQRSNFSSLNTLDARRHLFTDLRFRRTPMTTFGLTGRYDRSETPGEIDLDTGVLGERRTAERWQIAPSVVRRFGPRTSVTAGYDFVTEHLIEDASGTLHTARLGMARDVSSRTSVTGSYLARYFLDDLEDHWSQALLVGWHRELGPGVRVTAQAGPRATSYRGLAPEGAVGYSRATPYLRVNLDYWHGETIVLGIRGPVSVDSATARIAWPITRTLELGIHGGASDIETLDRREARIYRGTLVGSWTSGGLYTIAASYGVDYQQGDIRRSLFAGDHVLRHVFRVSVTVAPRLSRSILPPEEAARTKGVVR